MERINENITIPKIDQIDYELPEQRIARYPLKIRHDSKLLVYNEGTIQDTSFREIAEILPANSMLVFNDTKVIRARLIFHKTSGAEIEIFCLEPFDPPDYEQAFSRTGNGKWKCLVGNLKKWKHEVLERNIQLNHKEIHITASKIGEDIDSQIVEFEWSDKSLSFSELLESAGVTPIPPYLKRNSEPLDTSRYQTIYAQINGSVAAPTAGLHFTEEVIASIEEKGIHVLNITLHVGAGTFRPVIANSLREHVMHAEHFNISRTIIESLLHFNGSIIAIGTTSVRTLESLYWCGVMLLTNKNSFNKHIFVDQWNWTTYSRKYSVIDSLTALLQFMDSSQISSLKGSTQLMIIPGYTFNLIDGMVTNFHQPKSTLLLLVSALIGDNWKKLYEHALESNYRFLSYGDSTLLLKSRKQTPGV